MIKKILASALLALGLAACGGGDGADPVRAAVEGRRQALALPVANAADANAEALLDWAEASVFGPSYFWQHAESQMAGPVRFRFYPRTGTYLGVVTGNDPAWRLDGVYVLGGPFGNAPLYVGQRADFFTPPPDPAPGGALRFSPATLAVNLDEGPGNVGIDLVATPQETFSGTLYVVIDDPANVLAALAPIVIDRQGRAVTRVRPRDDLPLGLHQGTLQVHLCRTATCGSSELAGSPVPLPYRFGVVRNDPPLSFTAGNGTLSATVSAGESGRLVVDVSTSRWPADALYWRAVDAQGFVGGSGRVTGTATRPTSSIDLVATPPAAAGRYDGSVMVQVCRDSACTMPVGRQSFGYFLFRTVTGLADAAIGATPRLPPLQALPGAADWSGWQGGAAHTGYVPGFFDAANFSLRWRWALPSGPFYQLAAPAAAQGRVALAAQGLGGSADTELFVLDESDGSLRWRLAGDFPSRGYFSTPAVSSARLYTVVKRYDATSRYDVTNLLAYDLQTGERRFSSSAPTQIIENLPPVLLGDRVLVASGISGGLVAFDAASGERLWSASAPGYEWWTPASDGSSVFFYGSGTFSAFALADGSPQIGQTDPQAAATFGGGPLTRSFAVEAGRAFIADQGSLLAWDTRSATVSWRQATRDYLGTTAAQGGMVIALRQGPARIEARGAADGRLLWSTQPLFDVTQGFDLTFGSDPVLTDSHVFVSTERGVFAFTRQDGRAVWYYGRPGRLAISSNGVLLIAHFGSGAMGGGVTAINLR